MKRLWQRAALLVLALALLLTACSRQPSGSSSAGGAGSLAASGVTPGGVTVDRTKAVIDAADVLSDQTEQYVTNLSVALQNSCGAQIGVYTVEYIGNTTMESYCYDLFNAWGLGDADKDNGVLLLLATKESTSDGLVGDYYLMRGMGLESQLTSETMSALLNEQLEPSFALGDMDTGTRGITRALAGQLCTIYGLTLDLDAVAAGQGIPAAPAASQSTPGGAASQSAQVPANDPGPAPAKRGGLGSMLVTVFVLILILGLVVLSVLFLPFRRRRRPRSRGVYAAPPPPPPRRSPPPPPRRRSPPPPPSPPFGGGHRGGPPPRSGGSRPAAPRPSAPRPSAPRPSAPRSSGVGRSSAPRSGGSFRAGGGSTRGGGVGRR